MSTNADDLEALTRSEYFAERTLLLEARQRNYNRADQMVTGGSAGALVLSITFLEKIAPGQTVNDAGLLLGAWVVLLIGLGTGLASSYLSARAFDHQLHALDTRTAREPVSANSWNFWNRVSTVASIICLFVGIVLLAGFAYVNAPFNR